MGDILAILDAHECFLSTLVLRTLDAHGPLNVSEICQHNNLPLRQYNDRVVHIVHQLCEQSFTKPHITGGNEAQQYVLVPDDGLV